MVTTRRQPLYDKLVWQIKTQIADGAYRPGQKLPSVREMALTVSLNPNTVAKAYQALETEGVLTTVTGKGTFVTEHSEQVSDGVQERLKAQIHDVVVDARNHQITASQLVTWLNDMYQGKQ